MFLLTGDTKSVSPLSDLQKYDTYFVNLMPEHHFTCIYSNTQICKSETLATVSKNQRQAEIMQADPGDRSYTLPSQLSDHYFFSISCWAFLKWDYLTPSLTLLEGWKRPISWQPESEQNRISLVGLVCWCNYERKGKILEGRRLIDSLIKALWKCPQRTWTQITKKE